MAYCSPNPLWRSNPCHSDYISDELLGSDGERLQQKEFHRTQVPRLNDGIVAEAMDDRRNKESDIEGEEASYDFVGWIQFVSNERSVS